MTLLFAFVTIFSFFLENVKSNCFIDRVNEGLYFTECNTDTFHQFIIKSLIITNLDGSPNYPINFNVPSILHIVAINNGSEIRRLIAKSESDFNVKSLADCRWLSLPTFGLLDNVEMCYGCPWEDHSRITMDIELGPSSDSTASLFKNGIYGFNFHFQETSSSSNELGCVRIEFKTV